MSSKKVTYQVDGKGKGTKTTVENHNDGTTRIVTQKVTTDLFGFKHAGDIIEEKTISRKKN